MIRLGPYVFSRQDTTRTFGALGELWRQYTAGLHPVPAAVVAAGHDLADRMAVRCGHTADGDDPGERLDVLGERAVAALSDQGWDGPTCRAALEEAWLGVRALAGPLRASGAIGAPAQGRLVQINVSDGGVPKRAVARAEIDESGVAGDRQATRQHHGSPWQALCLWSEEVIAAFAAEGHPIEAGSAGENLTLAGLDWARVRPGVVVRIGAMRCEVSSYAAPCRHNARWFTDGDFRRIDYRRGPVSRVYATVLTPGTVAADDTVHLEPRD